MCGYVLGFDIDQNGIFMEDFLMTFEGECTKHTHIDVSDTQI